MKKVRFPIGIWRIPGFRCNFSSPAAKKREPKDSILPRWGVKKRRVFYSPKRIFCKGKIAAGILRKIGAGISKVGDEIAAGKIGGGDFKCRL